MKRSVVHSLWGKATLLGTGSGMALLVFWGGGGWFEQLGILEIAAIILFFFVLSDALVAWENERAIAEGRSRLYNDIVGELAVVEGRFSARGRRFGGKVRLGMERWSAQSDGPLRPGEKVRIAARQGLLLHVERLPHSA